MNWIKTHRVWSGIIALFILLIIGSAAGRDEKKTNNQTNQQSTSQQDNAPAPDYKFIESNNFGTKRQERHYVWLKEKPSEGDTKTAVIKLYKDCPADKICDIMIWDNESSYKNRNNTSTLSNEYSINNKAHLIGYRNSGGLFYYYGENETYLEL